MFTLGNQIKKSTYRKLNLLLTNNTYLVLRSLEMQSRLAQTKVYYFFYCVWKETTRKPLKVAAAKYIFPECMCSVQLASMSFFYFKCLLEDIIFYTSLSLL